MQKSFALLLFLGDQKRSFPGAFKYILKFAVVGLVSWGVYSISPKNSPSPIWWTEHFQRLPITFEMVKSGIVATIGYFLLFIFLRAFLPLLFFVPHAVAMREMGLLEANVTPNGIGCSIKKYLKWHDSDKSIRVICISGRTLFREVDSPLAEYSSKGQLEVLFPKSDPNNLTISARYSTYSEGFQTRTYPDKSDLIREIEISKGIIRANRSNKLYEHNTICMWRVVLLSDHCLIQNYFPNHSGTHSDSSPVFVFEREPKCQYSYYETFQKMFDLLKGDST